MAFAMFYGSDALLLDLFAFAGNRARRTRGLASCSIGAGRRSNGSRAVRERSTDPRVGIPWREDAASRLRLGKGATLRDLSPSRFGPETLLLSYGIPVAMRRQPINAVFGPWAWAFDDAEVQDLLGGGLLLDGVAAEILCRRGFGADLGVNVERMVGREEAPYAVERVVASAPGLPRGFNFNHNMLPRVAKLSLRKGAKAVTVLLTPTGTRFGPATTVFANRRGGRVAVLAAPNPAELPTATNDRRWLPVWSNSCRRTAAVCDGERRTASAADPVRGWPASRRSWCSTVRRIRRGR